MQKSFNKRLYSSPGAFIRDIKYLLQRRKKIKVLMQGEMIDLAFRERLMLAVTRVNDCRYCSAYHTRLALSAGISQLELGGMTTQTFEHSPTEQQAALLYAQHWAESDAQPEPEARRLFLEQYGEETSELIELSLRMIRVGNLTGNFLDYILFKLSLGKIR